MEKNKFKNKIVCGDSIKEMKKLPDKSVDMILCDLPYGTTQINEKNEHREYSIRFNWVNKDETYKRWQKYKQPDVDVAKLNSKKS